MKKIVAEIDSHIFEIEEAEYNRIFDALEKDLKDRGIHWDDSPFGCILNLCNADDINAIKNGEKDDGHYWTRKILTDKYHTRHKVFDLENYIKRSFLKTRPAEKQLTAKERLADKRAFESMFK